MWTVFPNPLPISETGRWLLTRVAHRPKHSFIVQSYAGKHRPEAQIRSRILRAILRPLSTKILDLRGFDSSRIFISRGGILRLTGDSSKTLSQRILAGIILSREIGRATRRDGELR